MLTLPIKKKWFDMIKDGIKLEEYREIKDYWTIRFYKNFYDLTIENGIIISGQGTVIFKNGYSKNSPSIKCFIELTIDYGKEKWGAKIGELYYVLKILSVEEVSNE